MSLRNPKEDLRRLPWNVNPLIERQEKILAAFHNEQLTEERAQELLDELGELEAAIQKE